MESNTISKSTVLKLSPIVGHQAGATELPGGGKPPDLITRSIRSEVSCMVSVSKREMYRKERNTEGKNWIFALQMENWVGVLLLKLE